MFGIFGTDDTEFFGDLPIDREVGIVKEDTSVCLGMVEVVAFIGEDRLIAQHGEAVCKTAWDEELAFVLFAQFDAEPLSVGGAVFAQIDGNVEYATNGAADQLRLTIRRTLEMQTAYHAVGRAGLVVLHESRIDTCGTVPCLVVRLHEIAPCVFEHLRLYHQQTLNRCFDNFHIVLSKNRAKVQQILHICKKNQKNRPRWTIFL